MSYQLCPLCKGKKVIPKDGIIWTTKPEMEDCGVCDGYGIIHELSGKPPGRPQKHEAPVEDKRKFVRGPRP